MPQPTHQNAELPEPSPTHYRELGLSIERMEMYTADQMKEYALASRADLVKQVEELKKDAERYRWLRDCSTLEFIQTLGDFENGNKELDTHFDAAMKEPTK